jgi:guanine deaminase
MRCCIPAASRCLAACYWARVPRVVFAATTYDVAGCGLEDLHIYEQVKLPAGCRSLRENASEDDLRHDAATILHDWARQHRH